MVDAKVLIDGFKVPYLVIKEDGSAYIFLNDEGSGLTEWSIISDDSIEIGGAKGVYKDELLCIEDEGSKWYFKKTSDSQTIPDDSSKEEFNEEEAIEEESEPISEPKITLGERNALEKAYTYLNVMAFSKSGLADQLEFEGFTKEEARYAVENCGADWNEQAAQKAQNYLDTMSFSRQGLIDQLLFEGFTQEQAEYGVKYVGY